MIGNSYDDADLYYRLLLDGCTFKPVDGVKFLHLFHPRLDYKSEEIMKDQYYNKKIFEERRNMIIRNVGREWGKKK